MNHVDILMQIGIQQNKMVSLTFWMGVAVHVLSNISRRLAKVSNRFNFVEKHQK